MADDILQPAPTFQVKVTIGQGHEVFGLSVLEHTDPLFVGPVTDEDRAAIRRICESAGAGIAAYLRRRRNWRRMQEKGAAYG